MLRSAKELMKYTLQFQPGAGQAGQSGPMKIVDYIFDDFEWLIRYVVVQAGARNYVLSTMAFGAPVMQQEVLPVQIDPSVLAGSPDIDFNQPFGRSQEDMLSRHYGWPRYWENLDVPTTLPGDLTAVPLVDMEMEKEPMLPVTGSDSELGSSPDTKYLHRASEIWGATVTTRNGNAGKLDDFIILDENWDLPYLVVDTGGLLNSKRVLLAPSWVMQSDYEKKELFVDLDPSVIQKSPEFTTNSALPAEYWDEVTDYYGKEDE